MCFRIVRRTLPMPAEPVNLFALVAALSSVEREDVGVPIHAKGERIGEVVLNEDAFTGTGFDLIVVSDDAPGHGAIAALLVGRAPIVGGDVVVAIRHRHEFGLAALVARSNVRG